MDYQEAIEARVTVQEAIRECGKHGIIADYDGRQVFECASGDVIATIGKDGDVCGGDVLDWLGY